MSKIKPYYSDKWVTIYHGDCREILPALDVKVHYHMLDGVVKGIIVIGVK